MTKKTCFMIQRFKEPYENRFENIYKPAVECVGLIPYRAGGPSAENITEDIEDGIRNAYICFADITEDNPNVWYEVGFAYACDKRIVMVCDETVRSMEKLPFDVRVKNVIPYNNLVDSCDNNRNKLKQDIIEQAEDRVKKAASDIVASSVTARQSRNSDNSLTQLEIAVLEIICAYDLETDDSIHRDRITSAFPDSERRRVLISLGKIEEVRYIGKIIDSYLGQTDTAYYPTEKGRKWYRENNSD